MSKTRPLTRQEASPSGVHRLAATSLRGMVPPSWLVARLDDPTVRIVDVRSLAAYERGHVPGAIHLDVRNGLFDKEGALVSALELARVMSSLGVGDEHTIVLVGDGPELATTAAVRAFVRYGHDAVFILEGGHPRWVGERQPISTSRPRYDARTFTARLSAELWWRPSFNPTDP